MSLAKSDDTKPVELAKSANTELAESINSDYIESIKSDYIKPAKSHDIESGESETGLKKIRSQEKTII